MKPLNPLGAVLVGVALTGWLMAVPADAAQNRGPRGGSTSQGSGGGSSQGSGGGSSQGSGGGASARPAPSGGGRTAGDGGTSSGGGTASGRAAPKPSGGSTSGTSNTGTRDSDGSGNGSTGRTSATARPTSGRSPTSGTAAVGRATPVTAGHGGGTTVVIAPGYYGGFYPWGYGGFGFGGYYGGYYGYYDPWLYGADDGYYGVPYVPSGFDEGKLRLKVKPRDAQVFVDGYFAGKVDDFDGVFQRLSIESGPHHISIRAEGYEPLELDVQIQPDRTITYSGDLRRLQ